MSFGQNVGQAASCLLKVRRRLFYVRVVLCRKFVQRMNRQIVRMIPERGRQFETDRVRFHRISLLICCLPGVSFDIDIAEALENGSRLDGVLTQRVAVHIVITHQGFRAAFNPLRKSDQYKITWRCEAKSAKRRFASKYTSNFYF